MKHIFLAAFMLACGSGTGLIEVDDHHEGDGHDHGDLPIDEPRIDEPQVPQPWVDEPVIGNPRVDDPVIDEPPPSPPQIDEEVEIERKFEFNVPSNTRLIQDGFVDAKCDTCAPEYVFAFDGLMDVSIDGTIVKDVLYDMTVVVDPVDVGRFPHTFTQAIELNDGTIQVIDNIVDDEWSGEWITNATKVDASTGHTFLFVVNLNLQNEEASKYAFRQLMAGFRINK